MSDQLLLFSTPRARAKDPDTSHDAARAITQHAGALRERVLEEFSLTDYLTDEELIERVPDVYWPTLKKRRSELTGLGLLVDSGLRRKNSRGRQMIVWRLAS
jgi:hypothetical protein